MPTLDYLIYYIIAPDPEERMIRQWMQSIRSLRRHDAATPVYLLHCGPPSPALLSEAADHKVVVHQLPEYTRLLAEHTTHWQTLAAFATLHKILCLDWLPLDRVARVLYLDCDTYWFAASQRLFDNYRTFDFYACAEVGSRAFRDWHGLDWYDPDYLDEDLLAAVSATEKLAAVIPFNSGVMLIGSPLCRRLLSLRSRFLETAARLLAGNSRWSHALDVVPLAYPSNNDWILDEIALWLTLGAIPKLKQGLFDPCDVPIANLHIGAPPERRLLAHYFSIQEEEFFRLHPRL
jgi:hypothetical protein